MTLFREHHFSKASGRPTLIVSILCLCLGAGGAAALEPAQRSDADSVIEGEQCSSRTGLYIGIGFEGNQFDPSLDERSHLETESIDPEGHSSGLSLLMGYTFGPHFGVEGQISVAEFETDRPDITGFLPGASIDGIALLDLNSRFRLRFLGGIGVALVGLHASGEDDIYEIGLAGNMGCGMHLHLGCHFGLNLDYKLSILNFEKESDLDDVDYFELKDIGGMATLQRVSLRLIFAF